MAKAPSEATRLRTTRAELKRVVSELYAAKAQCEAYRSRSTKAEQECADWRKRFDLLLAKAERVALAP